MNVTRVQLALLTLLIFTAVLAAAPPPAAKQPVLPELTIRQKNLLLQLSDAEANIQAINKALQVTGYRVGVAYNQIDSNLKGNELMDRKGGGPVRWDAFYGKTARDFYMHDPYGAYVKKDRPSQFDYIYQANSDQISRAQNSIANLAKNQQALLERRQKHEADQSRLWATLAFEQVRDREIDLHPISRFALTPAGSDANVLRPLILFLRTADRIAAAGLDALQADQPATFRATGQRMHSAYAELQQALADALDASTLSEEHRKTGQALKASCKALTEECEVIADNYANALDRDQAKQDNSKLEFRAQLQSSLSDFAIAVGKLDEQVTGTAREWKIDAARGTPTPDTVSAVEIRADQAAGNVPAPNALSPTVARHASSNSVGANHPNVDLLALLNPASDSVQGKWTRQGRFVECEPAAAARVEFPYIPPEEYDFEVVFDRTRGNGEVGSICYAGGNRFLWLIGGWGNTIAGISFIDGKLANANRTTKLSDAWISNGHRHTSLIKIRKDSFEGYLDGTLICSLATDFRNFSLPDADFGHEGTIGLWAFQSAVTIESASVTEVTGHGTKRR